MAYSPWGCRVGRDEHTQKTKGMTDTEVSSVLTGERFLKVPDISVS